MANKIQKKKKRNNELVSSLIIGFLGWFILTLIIISFISLTCNSKIIDFLYPTKKITDIPNSIYNNKFTNMIKNINNKIFDFNCVINCENVEEEEDNTMRGGADIFGLGYKLFLGDTINKIFKTIKKAIIKFENYIKMFNCIIITNTLKSQIDIINSVYTIFENKKDKNENFKNLTKILLAPILFVLKPIINVVWGAIMLLKETIHNSFSSKNNCYNLFIKLFISMINLFFINIIAFPILISQFIFHILSFTILPIFIIKNNSKSSISNIIKTEGLIPLLIFLLVIFNIPFIINLFSLVKI